jgi:hypothetical protein
MVAERVNIHILSDEVLPVATGQAAVSMPDTGRKHWCGGIRLQESPEMFSFDHMYTYATNLIRHAQQYTLVFS